MDESLKDLNQDKPIRENFGRPRPKPTTHFSDTSSRRTEGSQKSFSKLLDRQARREAQASASASEAASHHSAYQGSQRSHQRIQPDPRGVRIDEHNFMAESKIHHAEGDDFSSQRSLQEEFNLGGNQLALPPLPDQDEEQHSAQGQG